MYPLLSKRITVNASKAAGTLSCLTIFTNAYRSRLFFFPFESIRINIFSTSIEYCARQHLRFALFTKRIIWLAAQPARQDDKVGKKECGAKRWKYWTDARLTNNEEINIRIFFRECDVKIAQRVISMETESPPPRGGCFTSLFFVYANIRLWRS